MLLPITSMALLATATAQPAAATMVAVRACDVQLAVRRVVEAVLAHVNEITAEAGRLPRSSPARGATGCSWRCVRIMSVCVCVSVLAV